MEHIVILLGLRVIMVVQRSISYVNVFGPYQLLSEICVFKQSVFFLFFFQFLKPTEPR